MSTLAERIKIATARNPAVSQADLARACGVKPPSVADWLNGKTKALSAQTALLCCRVQQQAHLAKKKKY